jgi:hypothetical protein
MQVIGAGFGRTGTLSLKVALEALGFGPCHHMTELFDKSEHVAFWDEATDRSPGESLRIGRRCSPATRPPWIGRLHLLRGAHGRLPEGEGAPHGA